MEEKEERSVEMEEGRMECRIKMREER